MKNNPRISHQQFVSCLANLNDIDTNEDVQKLKEEDSALDLLFDLIEDLKHHVTIQSKPKTQISQLNFHDVEELLMRIVSGNYQPTEAQQFVDGLKTSSLFYERVLLKLRQPALVMEPGEIPEMANVQVKSNQEILTDYILRSSHQENLLREASESNLKNVIEKLRGFLFPPNLIPKYAIGVTTFVALLIFVPNISSNLHRQGLFDQYLVSADYQGSSLRAGSPGLDYNSNQQSFINRFELTMADYVTGNYHSAIDNFSSLELSAKDLVSGSGNEILSIIRDYYFYYGNSHLAVAQPGVVDFNRSDEEQHLQEAIRLISNAKTIAQQHNLDKVDRESYFLALANGFIGNKEAAIQNLKQLKNYAREADALIQEWSND